MERVNELKAQIEKLIPKAESGAQWAEICRLEAEMVAAMCTSLGVPFTVESAKGE